MRVGVADVCILLFIFVVLTDYVLNEKEKEKRKRRYTLMHIILMYIKYIKKQKKRMIYIIRKRRNEFPFASISQSRNANTERKWWWGR